MLRVLSLCDGLSGGMLAFRELGIGVKYHAVEIDRVNPEVGQLNKTVDQIRQYSKAIFGEVLYSSIEEENEFD